MQIESFFPKCVRSSHPREKLLKAQLSGKFPKLMCVSLASFDVFRKIFSLLQLYQNKLGAGK